MRRTLGLLLAIFMLFALTGCQATVEEPQVTGETAQPEPTAEPEELPLENAILRPEENGPTMYAEAVKGPIAIDGKLDEWGEYSSVFIGSAEQIGVGDEEDWTGEDDLSGRASYAWDAKNIYIGFEVVDDAIVQRYNGAALWKGDHVEIWFDVDILSDYMDREPSDDDFQVGLSPGNFDNIAPDIYIWQPALAVEEFEDAIAYAVERTDTGYTCEMRLPTYLLCNVELSEGLTMGASFELGERDMADGSEAEFLMATAPKAPAAYGNPTNWNSLVFTGTPQAEPPADSLPPDDTPVVRELTALNAVSSAAEPSDVTGIFGYGFDPGDISQPIPEALLAQARALVKQCADEGALWIDADTGITNYLDCFTNDPELNFYPLVRTIVEEAHKYGIKVFFYFSGSEIETPGYENVETPLQELHPDWLQIDQYGEPMVFNPGDLDMFWLEEGDGDAYCSPLAEGYREEIMKRAESVASFGADGIYVDVPYFFTFEGRWADFSEAAAAAFKEATGYDMPQNPNSTGREYYEWLEWRQQVWADFFAEMKERCVAKNPDVQVIVEEYPGYLPMSALETGLDTAALEGSVDIACHEYGHKQEEGGSAAYMLSDWQYTRSVYKWYQGFNSVNWSLCYASYEEDSQALAAMTWMHQQSFWEAEAPLMCDATVGSEWRKRAMNWISEFESVYNPAQSAAEVAVVYSSRSRNISSAASVDELSKIQRLLDGQQIPYIILHEDDIAKMHDFKYVIFPDVKFAKQEVLDEVTKYQGQLILTGEALTRDGWDENDVELSAERVSANEAVRGISTVPYKITGGDKLLTEVLRHGDEVQLRLFDPVLDDVYAAQDKELVIEFGWEGDAPAVYMLDFLGEELVDIPVERTETGYKIEVTVGLAALIGIK